MNGEEAEFLHLYRAGLISLHTCLVGLTWIFYDYFITLEDEIRYIWRGKHNTSRTLFLWIRYYSLALVAFDVVQIHVFARPGVPSDYLCVVMDPITRLAGGISLWSIEIILQLRIYALYGCSRKVGLFNGVLFLCSIVVFVWVLIHTTQEHSGLIADAVKLPIPGCPSLHDSLEWLQFVPATVFEGLLCGFALVHTVQMSSPRNSAVLSGVISLYDLIVRDNLLYFFSIGLLLIFNNLMVVKETHIPWITYSPFHAAMGILTTRMLLNVQKAVAQELDVSLIIREMDLEES